MTLPFAGLGPHPEFPDQLIKATQLRGGIRHAQLGEDAETWVFLGHPYHRDVLAAIETIAREDGLGWDTDDIPTRSDLDYTYARHFDACPDHTAHDDECGACLTVRSLEAGGWWLDWSGGGEDGKAHKGKPGYFPVVIWNVEG